MAPARSDLGPRTVATGAVLVAFTCVASAVRAESAPQDGGFGFGFDAGPGTMDAGAEDAGPSIDVGLSRMDAARSDASAMPDAGVRDAGAATMDATPSGPDAATAAIDAGAERTQHSWGCSVVANASSHACALVVTLVAIGIAIRRRRHRAG